MSNEIQYKKLMVAFYLHFIYQENSFSLFLQKKSDKISSLKSKDIFNLVYKRVGTQTSFAAKKFLHVCQKYLDKYKISSVCVNEACHLNCNLSTHQHVCLKKNYVILLRDHTTNTSMHIIK